MWSIFSLLFTDHIRLVYTESDDKGLGCRIGFGVENQMETTMKIHGSGLYIGVGIRRVCSRGLNDWNTVFVYVKLYFFGYCGFHRTPVIKA